ncbi:hypothetical protein EVAR_40583_1 [Eumeta japonica]|uniref:Uncharacterized protein n=1 Tax=Eumeta variegata TaxID=151549 RepID=A0A4C1VWI5_EUMVA|nr:hypothetical protein EVAR_40583_1 [Eumeta japonica]
MAPGATILTGVGKGKSVIIPRIPNIPIDLLFQFKKVQFPVKLSVTVTMNKGQGQTLQSSVDWGLLTTVVTKEVTMSANVDVTGSGLEVKRIALGTTRHAVSSLSKGDLTNNFLSQFKTVAPCLGEHVNQRDVAIMMATTTVGSPDSHRTRVEGLMSEIERSRDSGCFGSVATK